MGDIVDESTFDGSGGITVIQAEIVAVLRVETYIGCRNCNSKVTQVGTIGECTKCCARMKITKCKNRRVGRVILEDSSGNEHKLTMFDVKYSSRWQRSVVLMQITFLNSYYHHQSWFILLKMRPYHQCQELILMGKCTINL